MPDSRFPGPLSGHIMLGQIDDGTSCRVASPSPRLTGQNDHLLNGKLRQHVSIGERIRCVVEAYKLAVLIAPMQIRTELDNDILEIITGLLPSILQAMKIIGISIGVGASAGALVGSLAGGVGAVPGAAAGSVIGFDAGVAILTWMGLGFLLEHIAKNLGELNSLITEGGKIAWTSAEYVDPYENRQINESARKLSEASAILVRLILQGIVALLLKKGVLSNTRSLIGRATNFIEGRSPADPNISEVFLLLRKSGLGNNFADWIEKNYQQLLQNPKFRTDQQQSTVLNGSTLKDTAKTDQITPPGPQAATLSSSTNSLISRRMNLTPEGWNHIYERHVDNSIPKFANKSKFLSSADVKSLINKAQFTEPVIGPNGNLLYTQNADTIIGVDRTLGKSTSIYTVITQPNGNIVTAFPGDP